MDELLAKLTALMGGDTDEAKAAAQAVADKAKAAGADNVADASLLTESDWTGFGLPLVKARKLVADLKPAPAPAPVAEPIAPAMTAFSAVALLPQVPDDTSFLKLLQVGGTLKVEATDVMSAVRVLFAQRYGMFDIEDKLLEAIERRAEELEEPFPQIYYDVQKSLARKAHAEVLAALEVSSARVFTDRNKKAFLAKLQGIWDDLSSFNERAEAYQQAWMAKMANPGMMIAMMRGAQIPGLDAAPDTSPMLSAATAVIDGINKKFSGPGIPVARALAADAVQLRQVVEKPELVNATGSATREEMLRKLGLAVTADAARSEQAITQYVLAVMKLPDVPVTQLPQYIAAVAELGLNVPWDTLRGGARPNGGAAARGRSTYGDERPDAKGKVY